MTINELNPVKNNIHYTGSSAARAKDADFDAVYKAATVIYAQPETSAVSDNTKAVSFETPASLEQYFNEAASTYNVSVDLLKAVAKAESDFNPNCTSSAGAMGVMQLMPSTAATLGVADPYDAKQNIMGGAKLLSQLLNKYNGDTSLALAAYNAGSGSVDKYGGIPPYQETQNYVKKILGYLNNGDSIDIPGTIYASPDSGSQTSDGSTRIYAEKASDAADKGSFVRTVTASPAANI